MKPEAAGVGSVHLHLRAGPEEAQDLAEAILPSDQISGPGFQRFHFPPLQGSTNRDYYLELEIEGQGSLAVGKSAGDSYLNGALYQDGAPQDAQISFRLMYDPLLAAAGLLREFISWAGLLAAGVFLFILPGWALLRLLWVQWRDRSWAEKLALSSGVSLAIYPLLFLWTGLVGLRLGAAYAWAPPLIGLAILAWLNRDRLRKQPKIMGQELAIASTNSLSEIHGSRFTFHASTLLPDLTLILVLILVFAVRFWTVRGLEAPMLGDSYQHALIAQLLVDHKGLFDSWQPYADLQTFTYHFGFHTLAAVFHWVTRLALPQAVLWTGQILNGLAVLSLYPLAKRIGRSSWAGTAAVLVAGLLTSMPMFYTNWGRYTQLAGQVILLAAVYLAWSFLEPSPMDKRLLVLNWIIIGGLALTHYRVLVFAILFFTAFGILSLSRRLFRPLVIKTFWLGLGAGILFLPWFLHVFAGKILRLLASQVTTPANQISSFTQEYNAIGNLQTYLPAWLWLAMALALGWGLVRREKGAAVIGLWWLFNLLAANPQWLGLPGAGAIDSFAVLIAYYIPAAVLAGAAVGWLANTAAEGRGLFEVRDLPGGSRKAGQVNWVFPMILAFMVIAAGLLGARQRLRDLHPSEFALVTRPDIKASAWILARTPAQARFLVNSFFAFGGTTVVGSDAGWWLPLLASRQTTLPPINYVYETHPQVGSQPLVNALASEIESEGLENPEVLAWLKQLQVTHIYIGQQQGSVNYSGPYALNPEELQASPNFRTVYHQDRIWIFEILP